MSNTIIFKANVVTTPDIINEFLNVHSTLIGYIDDHDIKITTANNNIILNIKSEHSSITSLASNACQWLMDNHKVFDGSFTDILDDREVVYKKRNGEVFREEKSLGIYL